MIVSLDGQRLDSDFGATPTLQTLLTQVRAQHLHERLIVSVSMNGEPIPERSLDERLAQPLDAGDQVDLESGDPRLIAADALRDAAGQLAQAGHMQTEVADQLNAGQVAEAVRRVGEFVGVWQAAQQVFMRCCGLLGRGLADYDYEDRPVHAHLDELAGKLRELRDAFEARDMVFLADLLHYEMPPLCEAWQALLTNLADTLAGPALSTRRQT